MTVTGGLAGRRRRWPFALPRGWAVAWTVVWAVALLLPSGLGAGATAWPWLVAAGLVADGALFCATTGMALGRRGAGGRSRWVLVAAQAVVTAILLAVPGLPIGALPVLLAIALGAASVAGWVPPLIGLTAVASALADRATGGSWPSAVWGSGLTVLLAGLLTYAFSWLGQVIAELQCAREELARAAVEAERLRFARDLHDLLGHSLSLIVVKAQATRRAALRDAGEAAGHARDIETIGRQALSEVRQAVRGYRAPSLDAELSRAVDALRAAGVAAQVVRGHGALGGSQDELLGWVVREGVTNVIRHSRARHAVITTGTVATGSSVVIRDDGTGGDPAAPAGSGLLGLRERAQAAGGSIEATADETGFRLAAVIPPNPAGECG